MMFHAFKTLSPMEARAVKEIPVGDEWEYEPKWDGFRALVSRRGKNVELKSKSGQPLARYFPELVESLQNLRPEQFILDGEIVVPTAGRLEFDELLMRIHPAKSRIEKLSHEHPAMLIVFDLLEDNDGRSLVELPLSERRVRLEKFAKKFFRNRKDLRLSPATTELSVARKWFRSAGGNLDGLIAKRVDLPYQAGNRAGMQKIKPVHTVDCVVGGFRYAAGKKFVGSLLLGLYDKEGQLNHVGFTSSFNATERTKITKLVEPLIQGPGFTGHAPGGKSRWSTDRSTQWEPLLPRLVVEVKYDHFSGGRFRHGTTFVRWRPDKLPTECRQDQVKVHSRQSLKLLELASH
ncbi:MAG: ATP-dependent DNA ligase [Planctomycetales bacterium]